MEAHQVFGLIFGVVLLNVKWCTAGDSSAIEKVDSTKAADHLRPDVNNIDPYTMNGIPQEIQGSPSYKGGNWLWTGPMSDEDTYSKNKRFIGRWKNTNWVQQGKPANFGAYGYTSEKRGNQYGSGVGYFDDLGLGDNIYTLDDGMDKRQAGRWNLIHKQLQKMGYAKREDEVLNEDVEKRHGRWNLIHRQLEKMGQLKRGDGIDVDEMEEEKRMGGRWRLIQNKLQSMQNQGPNKRFVGRWKNNNWILQQAQLNAERAGNIHKRSASQ